MKIVMMMMMMMMMIAMIHSSRSLFKQLFASAVRLTIAALGTFNTITADATTVVVAAAAAAVTIADVIVTPAPPAEHVLRWREL